LFLASNLPLAAESQPNFQRLPGSALNDQLNKCWTIVRRRYTLLCMRKKLTAIRLKPEQVKKLAKIAVREDVPVSWLIRKAIDEFLKRKK
jgi:Ribbon-helix-helix domain